MKLPIGALAAAVAMPVVYGLLRRCFPVDRQVECGKSTDTLQREYNKWLTTGMLVWLLLLTPLLTWGLCVLFRRAGHSYVMGLRDFDMAITPHWLYWSFVAAFVAMLCGAIMMDLFFRLMMRRRYAEFIRFQELHSGFKSSSQWLLLPLLVLPCVIGYALMLNWYVTLSDDSIVINQFLSAEVAYDYGEIAGIRTAPSYRASDDRLVDCRTYVITFRDGFEWSTLNGPMTPRSKQWSRLVAGISRKSGVPMTELTVLE